MKIILQELSESLEAPIPSDWQDRLEAMSYLAGVPLVPVSMLTMIHTATARPSSALSQEYHFTLERKILGLP